MGKSRLFKILFGEWYAELTESINHKDFFMALRGLWGADFGELDQFSKADATRIKQVLTIKEDNYRPAYARLTRKFPRQCIFIGGTNRDDWNRDETGGRRFLPIKISGQIIIDWVEENRDQLWAEAVATMRQIEEEKIEWWDIPNAQEHQDARYIGDSWEEDVKSYLIGKTQVTTSDILTFALKIEDKAKHGKREEMRVGAIMRRLSDWEKTRLHGGKRVFMRKA
jgi:putative DNA primase/helicase